MVVLPDGNVSHEIDILAWDPTIAAPLYRRGSLVVVPHVAARLLIEVKSNITKNDLVESLTRLSNIKQKLRASWPQKGHRSYTLASVVGVARKDLSRDTLDSAIRSAPAVGHGLDLVDYIVVLDSHVAIAMRPDGH